MSDRKIKSQHVIIASALVVNFAIRILADFNSGFHGDELLHIDAGNHPAFGYMDFPPLIAWLAWVQNLFHSDSLFIHHLFVYLASGLIFVVSGLIAVELGGKNPALILIMSCLLFSPGLLAARGLFLPVIFEQASWLICIWLLVKYFKTRKAKFLVYLCIGAALGFHSKYSIVFLIAGIGLSVIIFQPKLLMQKKLWIGILIFIMLISPNLAWQIKNDLPVFNHFAKLYETQLDKTSVAVELKSLFLFLNPITSVVWIIGLLVVPFHKTQRNKREVAFALFFTFLILVLAKGKSYYFFPVILGLFPIGAVFLESFLSGKKWLIHLYVGLLCFSGIILMPNAVPVLPLNTYLKLYFPEKEKTDNIPLTFENYYSKEIWNKVLKSASLAYYSLSEDEKQKCLIWGRHYSQAGGINLLGKKYGLPQAFSLHSSYYNWIPDFSRDITIIIISDSSWDQEHWLRFFEKVEPVTDIPNRFASNREWSVQHIFIGRQPKYNSVELKEIFSKEIF